MNFRHSLPLLILALAGHPASAECIPYAESSFSTNDLAKASGRIFASSLDRASPEEEHYNDILSEFTISNPSTRVDPFIRLMLSYRAVELEQYNFALTNLELAAVLVNQTDLCEYKTIHYFIHAARVQTIGAIIGDVALHENDLPAEMYAFSTRGAGGPFSWLSAAYFEENSCVVRGLSTENIAQLEFKILQNCNR